MIAGRGECIVGGRASLIGYDQGSSREEAQKKTIFNPFSIVTYCFTNDSEIDRTILLILVRVYEGYKIKKDILHPFIPHTSFLKLYKIGK